MWHWKMTLNILKANEELLLIIKLRICLIYCSSIGDSRYAGTGVDRKRKKKKNCECGKEKDIRPSHNGSHRKSSGWKLIRDLPLTAIWLYVYRIRTKAWHTNAMIYALSTFCSKNKRVMLTYYCHINILNLSVYSNLD